MSFRRDTNNPPYPIAIADCSVPRSVFSESNYYTVYESTSGGDRSGVKASCGHDGGGLNMSGMSRSPPRKAAQVGSLEVAVVAGTW